MPIILRCSNCGAEEEDNPSSLKGTNWLKKGMIGGCLVLCPNCRDVEDNKEYLKERRKMLIDSMVEEYRQKLEKKITIGKVKKDREKFMNILRNAKKLKI